MHDDLMPVEVGDRFLVTRPEIAGTPKSAEALLTGDVFVVFATYPGGFIGPAPQVLGRTDNEVRE